MISQRISPPAWGWPDTGEKVSCLGRDFPTRVGMARDAMHFQATR